MAVEIRQPGTQNDVNGSWQNEGQIADNPTEGGDISTSGDNNGDLAVADRIGDLILSGFPAAGETYTALSLNVNWATNDETGNDEWAIEYSLNGGGAWGNFLLARAVNRNTTIQRASVVLANDQDLTQVQVRINIEKVGGGDNDTLYLYDCWTEGTYEDTADRSVNVSDTPSVIDSPIPNMSALGVDVADCASPKDKIGN